MLKALVVSTTLKVHPTQSNRMQLTQPAPPYVAAPASHVALLLVALAPMLTQVEVRLSPQPAALVIGLVTSLVIALVIGLRCII